MNKKDRHFSKFVFGVRERRTGLSRFYGAIPGTTAFVRPIVAPMDPLVRRRRWQSRHPEPDAVFLLERNIWPFRVPTTWNHHQAGAYFVETGISDRWVAPICRPERVQQPSTCVTTVPISRSRRLCRVEQDPAELEVPSSFAQAGQATTRKPASTRSTTLRVDWWMAAIWWRSEVVGGHQQGAKFHTMASVHLQ